MVIPPPNAIIQGLPLKYAQLSFGGNIEQDQLDMLSGLPVFLQKYISPFGLEGLPVYHTYRVKLIWI
jgi:hypothetical protein